MLRLFAQWILSSISLLIVTRIVPGFHVASFRTALVAAIVIALINVTLGALLKLLTFPLGCVTFGVFYLVINALMLQFASSFVQGFRIDTFFHAFLGAVVLAVLHSLWNMLLKEKNERKS